MLDYLGPTDELAHGLFGYSRAYNGGVLKMSDYSRSSNEVDSWSDFGTSCIPEIG